MNLQKITPLILTYNERENIERTLAQLDWAEEIIVIDSYSEDETLDLLRANKKVQLFQRSFDTMAKQWNFGLSKVSTDWVLSLDADYYVPSTLVQYMETIDPDRCDGYMIPFRYCVFGKPLVGSLLPPRMALFKKSKSRYIDDGHTQRLVCDGHVGDISEPILHDDRKPLGRWLENQKQYIALEAEKLLSVDESKLPFADKIRLKKWIAPLAVFFYSLFIRGAVLSGWRGVYYAYQRMFVESLLAIRIIEIERREKNNA